LERFGSTTRVKVHGRRLHPDCHGLKIASRQSTSRDDDPQVHTSDTRAAEAPMTIDERPNLARTTVGPFPAETLDAGVAYELLIFITTAGETEVLRAPIVVLRDC
jgi:hypothetical protein